LVTKGEWLFSWEQRKQRFDTEFTSEVPQIVRKEIYQLLRDEALNTRIASTNLDPRFVKRELFSGFHALK
jgi:hypothetical protein